jgi:P27 family predicted phage terminase small subunit
MARKLPANVKKLVGANYVKKADRKDLPKMAKLDGFPFKMPRGMPKDFQKTWKHLQKHCVKIGIASQVDELAVINFVETHLEFEEVKTLLKVEGRTIDVTTQHGTSKRNHPLATQCDKLRGRMMTLHYEFGMTASGLAKVAPNYGSEEPEADPTDEFFGGPAANAA